MSHDIINHAQHVAVEPLEVEINFLLEGLRSAKEQVLVGVGLDDMPLQVVLPPVATVALLALEPIIALVTLFDLDQLLWCQLRQDFLIDWTVNAMALLLVSVFLTLFPFVTDSGAP